MEGIIKVYNDTTSFLNELEKAKVVGQWKKQGRECSQEEGGHRTEFTTTRSYKEAQDLFKYGDRANFEKLQAAGLKDTNGAQIGMKKQRQLYTAVTGHAAHVPNYIAGIPTAMIAQRQVKVRQKVVNIIYDCTTPCSTDADEIVEACVELLNYVSQVEAAGVRVNLYVSTFTDMKGDKKRADGFIVKVKDSAQYIDLLKIAYPIVNPSFLRRHSFRWLETTPGVPYSHNYGYHISEDRIKKAVGETGIDGGIIITCPNLVNASDKQAYLKGIFNPEN